MYSLRFQNEAQHKFLGNILLKHISCKQNALVPTAVAKGNVVQNKMVDRVNLQP